MNDLNKIFLFPLALMLTPSLSFAQMSNQSMMDNCEMCGSMGWFGMLLGGLFMLSIFVAAIFLIVYVFKKLSNHNANIKANKQL